MPLTALDFQMMALALREAEKGLYTTDPNPRVGCVLVRDGQIVAKGWHRRAGEGHAEVNALREAGGKARGADCYVTLEPCSHFGRTPPCADALIAAGVKRVVAAVEDPNPQVAGQGLARLAAAGIEVESGCLAEQASALNIGFFKRMRGGKPYVRIKMATSLDGRTALANGHSQWITGPAAREDVQRLRARSSAVITGMGTLLDDDPSLNVRSESLQHEVDGELRQPLRVLLDTRGRAEPQRKLFQLPGEVLILTAAEGSKALASKSFPGSTQVQEVSEVQGRVDLHQVLETLAGRGCNEVLVEAGPTLAGALVDAGLVDELWVYQASKLMGHESRPAFHLAGKTAMDQVPLLTLKDRRMVGDDLRLIYQFS